MNKKDGVLKEQCRFSFNNIVPIMLHSYGTTYQIAFEFSSCFQKRRPEHENLTDVPLESRAQRRTLGRLEWLCCAFKTVDWTHASSRVRSSRPLGERRQNECNSGAELLEK